MEKLYKRLEIDIEVVKVLLEICYITEVDKKIIYYCIPNIKMLKFELLFGFFF